MKYKILISAPYLLPVVGKYRSILEARGCEVVVADVEERLEEADLLPIMGDIDGVVCGDDKFTAKVLAASPRLKVLSKWGTGIDSLDQAECARRGIVIKNISNAFSEPVGDTVLGWMLSFARRFQQQTENMRIGGWEKLPGHALNEKTLGVVGVGNTGKAVIRRAHAFGMRILGNDIVEVDPAFIVQHGMEMTDLESLLKQSDYVSLNCDLNETSEFIMNSRTLALLKPDAVLMNAARGPLIRENDLVEALQAGRIKGAALDVYEHEPLPLDSRLRSLPNVILSAHNANSSPLAWERVHERAIENMMQVLEAGS
ncbi:NAD(P)-dependent oxidoreductase [Thiocystis violacea]|uniref:NAD(P)-dependent oxidoreductase n=1 Tax=Thiocystis violacea TaxID=13725 RepID=UPI001903DAAF